MSEEMKNLNPQIVDIKIGIRSLRKITVYPLSVSDQFKMSDLITKALQKFFLKKGEDDVAFIAFLLDLIRKNLVRILELITEEKEPGKLLRDITNLQMSEIAMTIYKVNYGEPSKNAESLLDQIKTLFLSGRLLQQSVSDIQDTDSVISSEDRSEKED